MAVFSRARADALLDPVSSFLARRRTWVSRFLLALNAVPLVLLPFSEFQKELGSWAWILLVVLLFLSPVSRVLGLRVLALAMGFRKELGILMGMCAVAHSAGYFFTPSALSPLSAGFWWELGAPSYLAWGAAALAVTLPLWMTSNVRAMRLLGKKWKWLHRSAYVLLLLTALHVAFIGYEFWAAAAWVGAYAALKAADVLGLRWKA